MQWAIYLVFQYKLKLEASSALERIVEEAKIYVGLAEKVMEKQYEGWLVIRTRIKHKFLLSCMY